MYHRVTLIMNQISQIIFRLSRDMYIVSIMYPVSQIVSYTLVSIVDSASTVWFLLSSSSVSSEK